jgi:hypothetical protein
MFWGDRQRGGEGPMRYCSSGSEGNSPAGEDRHCRDPCDGLAALPAIDGKTAMSRGKTDRKTANGWRSCIWLYK